MSFGLTAGADRENCSVNTCTNIISSCWYWLLNHSVIEFKLPKKNKIQLFYMQYSAVTVI